MGRLLRALVSEAITHGRDAVDPGALAAQIHRYRSAVLPGTRQTAARTSTLIRNGRRLLARQDDYLGTEGVP